MAFPVADISGILAVRAVIGRFQIIGGKTGRKQQPFFRFRQFFQKQAQFGKRGFVAIQQFLKFTELLKYTYTTSNNDWVTIADEIDYIDNYIDLQLIRLDNHTDVVRDFSIDDLSANIPPMIFLTFVENAFKYGASTSVDCQILIRLHLNAGLLSFETENRIVKHSDEFRKDMPVGLDNCRNRLDVLYPGNYSLNIKEDAGTFNVELKINLQSND